MTYGTLGIEYLTLEGNAEGFPNPHSCCTHTCEP